MKKRIIGISLLIIIACLFIGFFVYPNFFKSDEPEIEILFVGDTSEDLNELYREKPGALMLNVIYGYCLSADLWGAAAIYFKKSLSIGSNTCTNRQFEMIMHRRVLSMDKDELKTVLRRGRYDIFFHESKKGVIPASLDELTELWYHQIHTKQTILP